VWDVGGTACIDCYCALTVASILFPQVSGFKDVDGQGASTFVRRLEWVKIRNLKSNKISAAHRGRYTLPEILPQEGSVPESGTLWLVRVGAPDK
jgi:hypothetical protein